MSARILNTTYETFYLVYHESSAAPAAVNGEREGATPSCEQVLDTETEQKGAAPSPSASGQELPEALFSWWTWPSQPPLEHLKRLLSPTSNMPCSKGCLQTSLLEAKKMSREDYVVRGILRTGQSPV